MKTMMKEWNEDLKERRSKGSAQFKGIGCASHQFWLTSNTAAMGYFEGELVVVPSGATAPKWQVRACHGYYYVVKGYDVA